MNNFQTITSLLIVIAIAALIIIIIILNIKKGNVDSITTRANQIDPLTGVQIPEFPGAHDTPETMVRAEQMEVVAADDKNGDDDDDDDNKKYIIKES